MIDTLGALLDILYVLPSSAEMRIESAGGSFPSHVIPIAGGRGYLLYPSGSPRTVEYMIEDIVELLRLSRDNEFPYGRENELVAERDSRIWVSKSRDEGSVEQGITELRLEGATVVICIPD